jgi:hypothetical protein
LTPNPIATALSSIQQRQVRALVMGGQACVLYGAAEFSRDLDLALSLSSADLKQFHQLLSDLEAQTIAVPPFESRFLESGHAAHFRCFAPQVAGLRIDVMAVLRGLPRFETLWDRRTTVEMPDGLHIQLLSLPDLIQSKKTQRDKDWPMIRRLVEAHYLRHREEATQTQLRFWLLECRTPDILLELVRDHRPLAATLESERGLLALALQTGPEQLEFLLAEEERAERQRDREYWRPLRSELEQLRRSVS